MRCCPPFYGMTTDGGRRAPARFTRARERLYRLPPIAGEVAAVTGFPELLDGRVKTLPPRVHAAILARRDKPYHMEQLELHGVKPIDMVVCNLYPFEAVVAKGASHDEIVENIDIG